MAFVIYIPIYFEEFFGRIIINIYCRPRSKLLCRILRIFFFTKFRFLFF